jgi:hypothetical protein
MTYDAMREMTAGLVQCGRKMQTAGPRATCSQRIRTARSFSLKQGRQDEAHRWANCWRSADDGLCRRVRHAAHDTKHPGRPRTEQDIRSLRCRTIVLPAICHRADRTPGLGCDQPSRRDRGSRNGTRRRPGWCYRRRSRRWDRRWVRGGVRHGGRSRWFGFCANVAAAAIRHHVRAMHVRARKSGTGVLATTGHSTLSGRAWDVVLWSIILRPGCVWSIAL